MSDRSIKAQKAHISRVIAADKLYFVKSAIISPTDWENFKQKYRHRSGDDTYSTLTEDGETLSLPSNAWWRLDVDEYDDRRNFPRMESLPFHATLRQEQQEVADAFLKTKSGNIRSGIFQAKCGWGKTFVACYQIANAQVKTLILVHTKQLMYQWAEEIEAQLGVSVGLVGDGVYDPQDITVGIYISVANNIKELTNNFGLVYVDECHRCPADLFSNTLNNINAKVKIGISATPRRKDNKHVILPEFFTLFHIVAKDDTAVAKVYYQIHKIDKVIHITDPKRQWAKAINNICSDISYLELLRATAIQDIANGRAPLIIIDRVVAAQYLAKLIPNIGLMIGSTSKEERDEVMKGVGTKYSGIVTTKLFDEGLSCHRLDTLYLTCPSSNDITWEQRIGRIQREHEDKKASLIRDFWFRGLILSRQQTKRLNWYKDQKYERVGE